MKKFILMVLLILIASQQSVRAEMRVWHDKKGNAIEAEFVTFLGGKVVLKDTNGKQLKVPSSGLCKEDQEYLKTVVPPEFEINVDVDVDEKKLREWDGYVEKLQTVQGTVTIEQKNKEPCSKVFKATLILIAKDRRLGEYRVVSSTSKSFSFGSAKKTIFSSEKIRLEYDEWLYTSSNYDGDGEEYEEYLVVIRDGSEDILATKSSSSEVEDRANKILSMRKKGSKYELFEL